VPVLRINGEEIEYRVLKTRQNRNIRLTVSGRNGVRISAPRYVPERELHAMVSEKAEWILDRVREFEKLEDEQPRWQYRDGASVLLQGKWTPLRVETWQKNSGRIHLAEDRIVIQVPEHMRKRDDVLRDLFERWIRRWAAQELPRRMDYHASLMQLRHRRVSVRDQRSKWGSCSAAGNISLNMRLMLVPPETANYIIIHELAHLRELNHSPRFWHIVEQYCPDRRAHQRWLRDHGWLLEMGGPG